MWTRACGTASAADGTPPPPPPSWWQIAAFNGDGNRSRSACWLPVARQNGSGCAVAGDQARRTLTEIWHLIYEDKDDGVQSSAARSRDLAIRTACKLLQQSYEVRRVIGPDGAVIERAELEAHYDEGRFPGLRRATQPLR
jgi:hypothetical protein